MLIFNSSLNETVRTLTASFAKLETAAFCVCVQAKEVEIAVHHLVRGANDVMQGHGQEETLISASKQVVAKTTALVYACKSKTQLGDTVETNLNVSLLHFEIRRLRW